MIWLKNEIKAQIEHALLYKSYDLIFNYPKL